MKYLQSVLLFAMLSQSLFANDGAFFAKGNQLIPVNETSISVKKEILSLKKVRDKFIEVSVYYEFYNPKDEKEITVGFEAFSPDGDVDGAPKNGQHPYMRNFTVNMNGKNLAHQIAYVADTLYNTNGKIKSIDLNKFEGSKSGNYVDFFYVYHFKAKFKKGINIIKHTYSYDLSGSVDFHYDFEYVLTAAKRWQNKQIDDFTLILDMGEFETFSIAKGFFKNASEWTINGVGKTENQKSHFLNKEVLRFHIQKGTIAFSKKNFKPADELFVYAQNVMLNEGYIPFSYFQEERIKEPKSEFDKKVFRNLPFARRGYVFKDKQVQQFYQQLDWYMPNPNYLPDLQKLTERERKWIAKWK
ncbi:hypothetical protein D3C87_106250 [compost metagenome]